MDGPFDSYSGCGRRQPVNREDVLRPRSIIAVVALVLCIAGACVAPPEPTLRAPTASAPSPVSSASPEPSASAAATESSASSDTGPPAGQGAETFAVVADDDFGHPMALTIFDPDAVVSAARAATRKEVKPRAEAVNMPVSADITVANVSPTKIVLVWVAFGCDRKGTIRIEAAAGQIIVAPDPINTCEPIPAYRGVVLSFDVPVKADLIRPVLMPTVLTGA